MDRAEPWDARHLLKVQSTSASVDVHFDKKLKIHHIKKIQITLWIKYQLCEKQWQRPEVWCENEGFKLIIMTFKTIKQW